MRAGDDFGRGKGFDVAQLFADLDQARLETVATVAEAVAHSIQTWSQVVLDRIAVPLGTFSQLGERTADRGAVTIGRVTEGDKAYVVLFEVPEATAESVVITVEGNALRVRAHRDREAGSYRGNLRLPSDVLVDDIRAEYADGVLSIWLPKQKEAVRRTIDVQITDTSRASRS